MCLALVLCCVPWLHLELVWCSASSIQREKHMQSLLCFLLVSPSSSWVKRGYWLPTHARQNVIWAENSPDWHHILYTKQCSRNWSNCYWKVFPRHGFSWWQRALTQLQTGPEFSCVTVHAMLAVAHWAWCCPTHTEYTLSVLLIHRQEIRCKLFEMRATALKGIMRFLDYMESTIAFSWEVEKSRELPRRILVETDVHCSSIVRFVGIDTVQHYFILSPEWYVFRLSVASERAFNVDRVAHQRCVVSTECTLIV